jgi:DNA/RNA-binding domain of Phe-tRNA-synthetase-like protein
VDIHVTDAWRAAFPDAHAGVLVLRSVRNDARSDALAAEVERLERQVRQRWGALTRAELAALPTIRAHQQHYRAFGQTYHLLGQLESVALKGRHVSSPGGALVSAMFAAEIDHLLLTAGHDVDAVSAPVVLDGSREGDRFVGISGREHVLRAGDMVMRDAAGIISAVLAGPDQRTQLRATTSHAMYVTYAPAGIGLDAAREHLEHIGRLVTLAAPSAVVEGVEIYPAV